MPRKKKVGIRVTLFFLILLGIELMSYGFIRVLESKKVLFGAEGYALSPSDLPYLSKIYDRELGWKIEPLSPFGQRRAPQKITKEIGKTDLAAFGDSFTYGYEVAADETWEWYLANLLKTNVVNFGVPGYGPDQALLLFRGVRKKLSAKIVTLGVITENIDRIMTRCPPFRKGNAPTKPRFILENHQLKLLPNPITSPGELRRLTEPRGLQTLMSGEWRVGYNQEHFPTFSFPYSQWMFRPSLWRTLFDLGAYRFDFADLPVYSALWKEPAARALFLAIVDDFFREAKESGALPILLIFPQQIEVRKLLTGRETLARDYLLAHCRAENYHCFDGISELGSVAKFPQDVARFYAPHHHLNSLGNRVIAEGLHRFFEKNLRRFL